MRYLRLTSMLCYLLLFQTGGLLPATAQEKDAQSAAQTAPPKPNPEVQALLDKANAPAKQSKWPEALKGYDEALAAARRLLDKVGEGTALNNIGNVYLNSGQPQKALIYYEQVL